MPKKTALVTGAGSGLGSAIARVLAGDGYDVAIHSGSNAARAESLAASLRSEFGVRAEAIEADFSRSGGAQQLFAQFRSKFDRLDLFVNNAGVTKGAPILQMTEETFDLVHNINWKNAYFSVQQAAACMVDQKIAGNMVIISSNHHAMNLYGASIYATVKEALVKFTRHAALEFAQYGIRVNCIAPGWIDTGEERMGGGQKEKSIPTIPMKRWVQPEEIGQWVLFLSSPAAASLTGDTLELDGGVRIMTGRPEDYKL
jgi:NAD(P)-dependent dehydrogenase (short-subunit alcohol dehydrogenase family)